MFKSRYSTVLTVILIILIISIIIIGVIFGIRIYKEYMDEQEREAVYAQIKEGDIHNSGNNDNNTNIEFTVPLIDVNTITNTDNTTSNNGDENGTGGRRKTQFYKGYPAIGYIKISKTNVSYPILVDMSPKALDLAVSAVYPISPKLNTPGNVVIVGHNYRNNKLFSNNKKLVVGDKIEITDLEGKTLTYTIYEIFQTSESDTAFWTKDRGNNTEISLSSGTIISAYFLLGSTNCSCIGFTVVLYCSITESIVRPLSLTSRINRLIKRISASVSTNILISIISRNSLFSNIKIPSNKITFLGTTSNVCASLKWFTKE